MTGPKKYRAMTSVEVYNFLADEIDDDILKDLTLVESHLMAEILKLHRRIDEIENQATEMMSPDAMMNMAQNFLGGGLVP